MIKILTRMNLPKIASYVEIQYILKNNVKENAKYAENIRVEAVHAVSIATAQERYFAINAAPRP